MPSVRGSHVVLWLVAAALTVFLFMASAVDAALVVLLAATGTHFLLNVLFSVRAWRRPLDSVGGHLPEGYQDSSPAVLEEVFAQEGLGEGLVLPVRVEGEVTTRASETAPWSGKECVGWSLQVELYRKTALGGDADYTPLLSRHHFSRLEVSSDGRRVVVEPPGMLRGGTRAEDLLGWKALGESPALRDIVDNELKLRGLARKRFTGVSVVEQFLEPREKVVVYGRASKGAKGIELRGTDTPGSADALLVLSSVPRPARARRKPAALRLAASVALLAAGWFSAALLVPHIAWWQLEKAYPWLNVERVGSLHWKGQGTGITVALQTLNLSGPSDWTLDASDEDVELVSGDQSAFVKASTELTVTRPRLGGFVVVPAAPAYPRWAGGRFVATVPDHSPGPEGISMHEGPLRVVNLTGEDVEIRFAPASGKEKIAKESWTIEPATGSTLTSGTRLVLADEPFSLTEGDGILLRKPGASGVRDAFVTLGGHPAAAWDTDRKVWVLTVDARALEPRIGTLEVRNPAAYPVKVEITDRSGQSSQGSWTLQAGFGGDAGVALESGGRPFVFREGYLLRVDPQAVEALYHGSLAGYRAATYQAGAWTIGP